MGDDGSLYFCYHGFSIAGAKGSAIVRIPKGRTDFDSDWIIKADDYTQGTTMGAVCVKDGKVYFRAVNNADQNGYYVLEENNTATQAFNVSSGGIVWGFAKLTRK